MSKPLSIVFDFGAVLVNWRPAEVVRKHFPNEAQSHEAAAQLASQLFAHADWQSFDAGHISSDVVAQLCSARLKLDLAPMRQMVAAIEDHIKPIETSVKVLETLHAQRHEKNYKLFFLSNMPAPYARGLERHAFMRCFDGGIFSGDHGLVKPQPEIFQKLEAMYGLQAQSILFIDDHLANIAAAQMQGWKTLHLTEPSKLPELLLAKLTQSMS